ncbi:MAG: hypothetical protein OEW64_07425 [Gammaproteobacteria bacterium]|nr:hypothetical protein [Gammaproteobacteria bacterium]MDH5303913.1 hypothetical protein [Gammaproteobacteria bacterium]MDH5321791.1 hypothetical protein [Gammaproteobacteria bacterium]
MRILILAIVLTLSACSDSDYSGSTYCYSDGPIVSNLALAPNSALVGEGGGTILGNVTLHYRTRDDAKIIAFEYRIEDVTGLKTVYGDFRKTLKNSGDFGFAMPISTATPGMYTVRVRAVDECIVNSKWADALFEVIAAAPVAGKSGYATVALNGFLYFAGGLDEDGLVRDSLLQYDPATQRTETRAPMPEGRELAAAAAHNGIIYVFGGMAYGFAQNSVFAYDTGTDTWTAVAPMSTPIAGAYAVTVDDMIYVDGAYGLSQYDPTIDQWTDNQDGTHH